MEITIITTQKKLTKSLLAQMRRASKQVMTFGIPLGFIINGVKNTHKVYLISYLGDYFIIPSNYEKRDMYVTRSAGFNKKVGALRETRKFDSPEKCDGWWASYQRIAETPMSQIYI